MNELRILYVSMTTLPHTPMNSTHDEQPKTVPNLKIFEIIKRIRDFIYDKVGKTGKHARNSSLLS